LKELLSKHNLPQTGKKDDLVKRLLENNVGPDAAQEEEELVSERRIPHSSSQDLTVVFGQGWI
jgi:hypothetical protein